MAPAILLDSSQAYTFPKIMFRFIELSFPRPHSGK